MARQKNENGESGILSLLTTERRQEILDEVSGSLARKIFGDHHRGTLGDLVRALEKHGQWRSLRKVTVGAVLARAGAARGRPVKGNRRRRRGALGGALLDKIVATIEKKPGLRSEELKRLVDAPAPLVKAGLARLRLEKRVKTKGVKRATTYTVA